MYFRPLLSEETQSLIEKLGENPVQVESDLAYLKEWLRKQPHLPKDIGKKYFVFKARRICVILI